MAKNKREKGENSGSNKGVGILIGVLIVITWLSVMCLLIKCDVGGFGSRVLRPVFKDVPVINKILPDASDEEVAIESDYPYTNLEDALKHIADQDAAIGSKDAEISELNDKVTELQAEVDRLTTIAKDQSDFEDEKKKFYDEIVYGDSAPDTDTYKEWYNELDAESAAEIYQQVLEQDQADDSIKKMAQSYEEMNASEAAKILETMGNDLDTGRHNGFWREKAVRSEQVYKIRCEDRNNAYYRCRKSKAKRSTTGSRKRRFKSGITFE